MARTIANALSMRGVTARLPIRWRLTLAFTLVMAVVLVATGSFLYLQFRGGLDRAINQGLRSRAGDVVALVQQADSGLREAGKSPLTKRSESFAQILSLRGGVLDATPLLRGHRLLSPADLARAARRPILLDRGGVAALEGTVRLLAVPAAAQDQRVVVVVGASLETRHEALSSLGKVLVLGGPAALLLASLAGYGVALAALRPVEAMRRRAAAISAASPEDRLPVGRARDELARLGTTLNAMLGRLQAALLHERRFVADASHELRTPLAILKAELELALRPGRPRTALEGALSSAAHETDRLSRLTDDLLVLARAEDGSLPVRLGPTDVCATLHRVAGRFASRAAEQQRPVEVRCAEGLEVVADGARLEQALGNGIDNALRHGAGVVRVEAALEDGGLSLRVRDEGPGFSDEFASRAFKRFSRADAARGGGGGAGLGLAIVQGIAQAHGGSASVANATEGGGQLTIRLPLGSPPGSV